MLLNQLFSNKKTITEGGNLSSQSPGWQGMPGEHEAEEIDLKLHDRDFMVDQIRALLQAQNESFAQVYGRPIWDPKLLDGNRMFSGSTLHFFDVKGISTQDFLNKLKKTKVGDIDTQVDQEIGEEITEWLKSVIGKKVGNGTFVGFNSSLSALWLLDDPPVRIQVDYELGPYQPGKGKEPAQPTEWFAYSHSSDLADLQQGIKGVFHKYINRALTQAQTSTKYVARVLKKSVKISDEPVTDSDYSFAVTSSQGGGLAAKYKPYIDPQTGQPMEIDGIPVMQQLDSKDRDYIQNLDLQFQQTYGKKRTAADKKLQNSFVGTIQLMNTSFSPEQNEAVARGFFKILFDPGEQMISKDDPARDRDIKFAAVDSMLLGNKDYGTQPLNVPNAQALRQEAIDMAMAYEKDFKDVEAYKKENPQSKQPRAELMRLRASQIGPVTEGSIGEVLPWPVVANKISSAMKAMGWKAQRKGDDSFMFSTKGAEDESQWYMVMIDNEGNGMFSYALGTFEGGRPDIGEQDTLPTTEASVSEVLMAIRDGYGLSESMAEARRNPEQNRRSGSGKYDLINYAEDINDKDNWAVSMTMEPKLGINPQAAVSEDTPKGIYFYPLRYFMQMADRDKSLPWGDNFSYLQLFQYDRSGEMTQQTKVESAKLKQALLQYCPEEVIQSAIDEPEYDSTPYWFIYDCLSRLGKNDETNVVRWNKVLRDLGFTSVFDPGRGWIAYNEPTQGVILDPRIIKQHKMFDNRNPTLQSRKYDLQSLADAIGYSSYYQRESQLQRISYDHPDKKKVMLDVAKTMLKQFLGKSREEAKALGYDQAIKASADKVIEILKQPVTEGKKKKSRNKNKLSRYFFPGYGYYGYGGTNDSGEGGDGGGGMEENFADGRNPQDKGDAKRYGINTKASISSLRKTAKQGGRKGQLAHWLANMKAGRAKKKESLSEAEVKAQLRKGMPHLRDLKPADFLDLLDEIHDGNGNFKLQDIPLNVKVDGFGGRFGKNTDGQPFMATSRTEPRYQAGFLDYHKQKGTTDPDVLRRAGLFDDLFNEMMAAIAMVDESLGPDFLVNKQVTCEVLFAPFATETPEGKLKFVGIEYDRLPQGVELVLVPYRIVDATTGEDIPETEDELKAITGLGSQGPVMFMSNRLVQKDGLDVTAIIPPLENLEELKSIVSDTAGKRDKASLALRKEVEEKLKPIQIALEKAIDEDPNIIGKDMLGQEYEGIVINSRLGPIKVTSQRQKDIIAAKNAARAAARTEQPRENQNKTAVVAIGSFVGHKGHEQLWNLTVDKAAELSGDPYLFIGTAEGKDDPIPPNVKVQTWHKLYPEYANNISTVTQEGGSLLQKVKHELINPLPGKPPRYDNIVIAVGQDRANMAQQMSAALMKAVNKFPGYEHVKVTPYITARSAESGGTGVSFTGLRNALANNNLTPEQQLDIWSKGFDVGRLGADWLQHLMDLTRRGMGIQQMPQQQPVAERLLNALIKTKTSAELELDEDWQKVNRRDKTDGMSRKAVKAYRRENPGSKLKTAVTTKPSKLKKGGKSAKRRKSFCARMSGMKKAHASAKTKRDPDSPINKALRRWNCESIEEMQALIVYARQVIAEELQRANQQGVAEGMEGQVVFSGTGADGGKYEIIQTGPTDFMIHANGKHIDTYSSLQRAMSVLKNEVPGLQKGVAEGKIKGVDGKACWKGYKRMGTKKKGGRTVDNCVPINEDIEQTMQKYIDLLIKKNR